MYVRTFIVMMGFWGRLAPQRIKEKEEKSTKKPTRKTSK
jgi:hypothetical protein